MKNIRLLVFLFASVLGCDLPDDVNTNNRITPGSSSEPIDGFGDYYVEQVQLNKITLCNVTFNSYPPNPEVAKKVVMSALKKLIKEAGEREILATAFDLDDNALPRGQYGGPFVYKPDTKKIEPFNLSKAFNKKIKETKPEPKLTSEQLKELATKRYLEGAEKIKEGQTLEEVVKLMGPATRQVSKVDKTITRSWVNGSKDIFVVFVNGKVTGKTKFGF